MVWLGEEIEETAGSLDAFRTARRLFPLDFTIPSPEERDKFIISDFHKNVDWASMSNLMCQPWFRRKWIIQEMVKSKEIIVAHGSRTLDWADIHEVSASISLYGVAHMIPALSRSQDIGTAIHNMYILAVFYFNEERKYNDLINASRGFLCTDPRDQYFALFGLATDKESIESDLYPDYIIEFKLLIRNYVQWSLVSRKSLDFLGYTKNKTDEHHPAASWTPDFSQGFYTSPTAYNI